VPPACRPGTAAAAAVVVAVAVALALRGVARTAVPATPGEPAAPLIGPRVRAWYRGVIAPLEDALVAWGIHADSLTYAQLAVSVLARLGSAGAWIPWKTTKWSCIAARRLGTVRWSLSCAGPRSALSYYPTRGAKLRISGFI